MDNKIVVATLCFAAGAGLGFAVGYSMNRKESEAKEQEAIEAMRRYSETSSEEEIEEDTVKTAPVFKENKSSASLKKPEASTENVDYSKMSSKVTEETAHPSEDDDYFDEDEVEEDEEGEYVEEPKQEKSGKIELMMSDEWDTDFPETDYEHADLYFFTEDETLTDEDGKVLPEEEYIGTKPRQVGWMRSPDDVIYVRNHAKEMEYRVFKEHCSVEDWF